MDLISTSRIIKKTNYRILKENGQTQDKVPLCFQRIPFTVNTKEQKQALRDMDLSMRASAHPNPIECYGALFWEGDIWIMMKEMDASLEDFYKLVYENNETIPEEIIAKIASCVSNITGC